jgi:hypothetical protein
MQTPGRLHPFLAAALLAGACTGNSPQPPSVIQAGWSWLPSQAGDRPLPVTWQDAGPPVRLPLLDGLGCAASGSAQALANLNGAPVVAGISVACRSGSAAMYPVVWQGGAVTELPRPAAHTQGTALAAAVEGNHLYVAGATGTDSPMPAIWLDGVASEAGPFFDPRVCDSGLVTSLVVTSRYAIAAGTCHVTGSNPPAYAAMIWVLDPDLLAVNDTVLFPPGPLLAGSAVGGVATAFDGLQVYSTAAISKDGLDKPVFWLDDQSYPISGTDFLAGPWGVPTGIALVGTTPYVTGFLRTGSSGALPQPVIWTPRVSQFLPAAGSSGSGEAIRIYTAWAFAGGESLVTDPSNPARAVSIPALWINGERTDLAALAAPGGGPLLAGPLDRWWKVPGPVPQADWPYPGGFAQLFGSGPVAAAGSAVARALVTIP